MRSGSTVGMVVLSAALFATVASSASKPNIVYILADDLGIGDVQVYNPDSKILTPNIDRLASEGMKFTDVHTADGVCTPSRYAILTGRYCWRSESKAGVLRGMSKHLIEPTRETVASFLKKQGYATACVGKWHLGMDWNPKDREATQGKATDLFGPIQNGPLDLGFDYYFGMSCSFNLSPHAFIEGRQIQGTLERFQDKAALVARGIDGSTGWVAKEFEQDQVLSTFTEKTCDWIRQHADKPFFAYMPLNSPHYPLIPRDEFRGKSGLSLHGDFVMETDWAVGEVLKTLDELKLANNTIVIFTSDNGVAHKVGNAEMQEKGHFSSGIYRGCKGNIWEGGHRVPFLVRWPKTVKAASVCDAAIGTVDLMATCAELCEVPMAGNAGEDSASFLPALKGELIPGVETRALVHHSDKGTFALRRGRWKLVLDDGGPSPRVNPKDQPIANHDVKQMLFDMDNDVTESTNVASQHPETVESMKKELTAFVENGRSTPGPNLPTDVATATWPQLASLRVYMSGENAKVKDEAPKAKRKKKKQSK
ncbi:Arylsulfatase [Pontiella sulfatireligans]|uniref:Arylsulfatase n=2 Tax=Pontiella sulfatireligans TaxID=2750658 RepID=A0A6C2UI89_9BACT|nr:sulfatase S1_15 [Kiritimatiellales bacterium]VGO18926.1 Arylsulfatase [Pontiella sulfatireligans]